MSLEILGKLTSLLITINLIIYAFLAFSSRNILIINYELLAIYGQYNLFVYEGWLWQLFTSIFVHANLLHVLGNSLFLAFFGFKAEELFSKKIYLFIYFSSGFIGNLLTLLMGSNVVSVGASGAIFGLFGASIMYMRKTMNQPILSALIYSFYLFLINAGAGVNLFAHFGGLAAGLIIGYSLAKKTRNYYNFEYRFQV
ncbi:rhomboid family intramembrane serine protease [Candidatus Bathyarchaeota archaeon]|nr:rhomboid family intramembrane serine protease [Candidatus Bathyarchaeota archaeon]